MERVDGIGGFFFRAEDPAALARWYAEHLGVNETPMSEGDEVWMQTAGPTAFAPFGADDELTPHGPGGWGINFRVSDLDAMVAQLRAAGVEVTIDPEDYGIGRFADLRDPEGNAVQLWQPA